jgi:hypothetical protein
MPGNQYTFSNVFKTKMRVNYGDKLLLSTMGGQLKTIPAQEPITYNYKLYAEDGCSNLVTVSYTTSTATFAAISVTPLYNPSWENTDDTITFSGFRLPSSSQEHSIQPPLPSTYTETIDIVHNISTPNQSSFLTAKMNYVDNGSGFATQLQYLDYVVTGANGIFSGKTNLRINFDNVNYTREVIIT